MLVYDLFRPAACNGAIIGLQQSSDAAYRPFEWNPQTRSWIRSGIAIDKYMALPRATPTELSTAGLTFRDFEKA
jgi:hypothetical protein